MLFRSIDEETARLLQQGEHQLATDVSHHGDTELLAGELTEDLATAQRVQQQHQHLPMITREAASGYDSGSDSGASSDSEAGLTPHKVADEFSLPAKMARSRLGSLDEQDPLFAKSRRLAIAQDTPEKEARTQ